MPTVSGLTIALLGAPLVEIDGARLGVDTRKAIAVLAYLAVTGQTQSRDALATLLWPEYDQTRARSALRRTLSTLKRALGGRWLEVDRANAGFDPAGAFVDVTEFRTRLGEAGHGRPEMRIEPLTEAVKLYRGDFLEGFTLRDSPPFDDWQFFQSEGFRRELAGALERLVEGHVVLGEFAPAIEHARRRLAIDPLHEPAHRQLMQLFAWGGERAAALRQYRECAGILDRELGVEPVDETTHLYRAIMEDRLPAPEAAPAPAAKPAVGVAAPSVLPLVGRSAEWQALLDVYRAAGDGRIAVIEGEAGIGKTRLAEEFLTHARAAGAATIAARCYEEESDLAYGPVVEWLRATATRPGVEDAPDLALSEASRLLPELTALRPGVPPPAPLAGPGAQSRLQGGIVETLTAAAAGEAPGVLFLDDLHWADEATLDFLAYLARRLRGRPLMMVWTWRSEDVGAGHRLRRLAGDARRDGSGTVIAIGRLTGPEVAELIASATGSPSGELAERLYEETEGNPFFLSEYLASLPKEEEAAWPLPRGVRDLLRGRLASLGEVTRQVLAAGAAIGRSFDLDVLREASGRSEEETVAALEELVARGFVHEVAPTGHDFSHEKMRELVYEETGLARRRLLHRRVAEALLRHSRGLRDEASLSAGIAHHFRLAGREGEAAEHFRRAGERARALHANAEALEHLRAALALGHPDAAAVHEAIGDVLTLRGEYGAALASYETAAAMSDPKEAAGIEHKLGNLHHRRGDWDLAESHFRAALDALLEARDDARLARVYADQSLTAHHRGDAGRASHLAEQALGLGESAGDTRALAQAHNILGILAGSGGDVGSARQHLESSLAAAEAARDPGARAAALNNLALAWGSAREFDRAIETAREALALCAVQGDRHREAALHNNLADLLHAAGRHDEAMDHLKQAVAIFAEIGEPGVMEPQIWKLVEW